MEIYDYVDISEDLDTVRYLSYLFLNVAFCARWNVHMCV